MKADRVLTASSRDGFLRVDFYKNLEDVENVGLVAGISSRIYDTGDWVMKRIIERAPDEAEFMVVSLQTANTINATFWLDDVVIEESEEVVPDIGVKDPYDRKEIDLNILYPNSHGNL